MDGKPAIKGTRLTVNFILNLFAHGKTQGGIISEYKGLVEDVSSMTLMNSEFTD
jgi:uncharacterized protein (DUF433 family)